MTEQETSGLSKRAAKRLAKQQQQPQEYQGGTPLTATTSADSVSTAPGDDAFMEYLQKRIRNLQKRKQRLDKYEEVANSGDKSSLNQDQLNALQNKEAVETPLKDLNELLKLYKARVVKQQQDEKVKEKNWEKKTNEMVEAAKLEGLGIGKEKLDLTVKLLRAVSYKRVSEFTQPEETAALEQLLQWIYVGDETSLTAIDNVYDENEEPVVEGSITFKQVKEIALTHPDKLMGNQAEEQEQEQEQEQQAQDSAEPEQKSMLQKISFLQDEEDEIEGDDSQQPPQQQPQSQSQSQNQQKKQNQSQNQKKRKPYRKYNKKPSDQANKNNGHTNSNGTAASA